MNFFECLAVISSLYLFEQGSQTLPQWTKAQCNALMELTVLPRIAVVAAFLGRCNFSISCLQAITVTYQCGTMEEVAGVVSACFVFTPVLNTEAICVIRCL